jgi:hypothetical protein
MNGRNEYIRLQQVAMIQRLGQRVTQLEKGINDYLEGNYEHPRANRPQDCKHHVRYWEECGQCDTDHFTEVMKP